MLKIMMAAFIAASGLLFVGGHPARAQSCPGGERALPETGLCPAEAIDAFLSKSVRRKAEAHPGCSSYGVNETRIGDNVLLYGALRCGSWIGRLEYAPGAKPAKLMSRLKDGSQDVEIVVLKADAADPKATINAFARNAIKDANRRRECLAQERPNAKGAIIFDLDAKTAARIRKGDPSGGECGPYGDNNGPNHWRAFGGHVWYFGITDYEHSFDPAHMVLLERDKRGGGLKGWRVKY